MAADAACLAAPVIVDIYLVLNEPAVHGNPDAGPGARIAAFAGSRPMLGEDRLTVCPAWFHRMALAELRRVSVASMESRRAGQALAELIGPLCRSALWDAGFGQYYHPRRYRRMAATPPAMSRTPP